jgi:hypothetical protein
MGKSAYKNTFKSKNTYENILTGINKEEVIAEFTTNQNQSAKNLSITNRNMQ